ncbi:hypothetical protein ACF08N_35455 [Streptomyces sp. NPDC015127]|uniref:hypothetical protein n=1 Tax=Streptomyces sp. NPDC015127 TaxID=3364939 RepID=UPI0037015031
MTLAGVASVWGTLGRADGWDLERVITEGYERSIWTSKSVEFENHPPLARVLRVDVATLFVDLDSSSVDATAPTL